MSMPLQSYLAKSTTEFMKYLSGISKMLPRNTGGTAIKYPKAVNNRELVC